MKMIDESRKSRNNYIDNRKKTLSELIIKRERFLEKGNELGDKHHHQNIKYHEPSKEEIDTLKDIDKVNFEYNSLPPIRFPKISRSNFLK